MGRIGLTPYSRGIHNMNDVYHSRDLAGCDGRNLCYCMGQGFSGLHAIRVTTGGQQRVSIPDVFCAGYGASPGRFGVSRNYIAVMSLWAVDPNIKVADKNTLEQKLASRPASGAYARGVCISPNETWIAAAGSASPYVARWQTSDWSQLANLGTPPAGNADDVGFSPDESLMASAGNNSPYIDIYNTSDWSKVANPGTLPTGDANAIAFSPNGTWCAVAHKNAPRITIYTVSGWSKVANPGTLPSTTAWGVTFSHDSAWLAVTGTSPDILVYNTSDWSVAATINPGGLNYNPRFNADDSILAVASSGSPYFLFYDTSDWSAIPALADTLDVVNGYAVEWEKP